MSATIKKVTVIYYNDNSLQLLHDIKAFTRNGEGRVIIPDDYKKGKSIIAVCEGDVNIINKLGDRILPFGEVA